LKPWTNQSRKKNSGTPMTAISNFTLGSTSGVDWFSRRARYLKKKNARNAVRIDAIIVTVMTK
jgi:hypothetical protein